VLADPTTVSTRAQITDAARDLGIEVVRFEAAAATKSAERSTP
jgi:hypothetical protein